MSERGRDRENICSGRILGDLTEKLMKLLSLGWVCMCVHVHFGEGVSFFFVEPWKAARGR